MFNPDSRFHYTTPDTGAAAWSSLMPSKYIHNETCQMKLKGPDDGGILSIQDPQKYQLPASYKDRNSSHAEVYSMSMFHQLHCLVSRPSTITHTALTWRKNSIRIRLGSLEGFINATDSESHHRRNVFAPESHVEHCFDYLRQVSRLASYIQYLLMSRFSGYNVCWRSLVGALSGSG